MRRVLLIAAAAALLGLTADAAVAGQKKHVFRIRGCPPFKGRVLAGDSQAAVYVEEPGRGVQILGCVRGASRAWPLGLTWGCGGASLCGGFSRETVGGYMAAYEWSLNSRYGAENIIVVRDLRNGQRIRRVPTGVPKYHDLAKDIGGGPATAIVVKADGAVAWIDETSLEDKEYEVRGVDGSGSHVFAGASKAIDPHSLGIAGSTIYWTEAGKPYSAELR